MTPQATHAGPAIRHAIRGALLLARGRAEGLALIAVRPEEERRWAVSSFWAMALCLPAFLCLHLMDWATLGLPAAPVAALAGDLMASLVAWLGFAVFSHELVHAARRDGHWLRFLAVWNWCNFVQYLLLLVASVPAVLGLPDALVQTAWLVGWGWALWLEWYATRLALDIPGMSAACLVGLDFAIGVFAAGLATL